MRTLEQLSWKKKVFKNFQIKNLSEYNDLHLRSNTLLLADVSENLKLKIIIFKYLNI